MERLTTKDGKKKAMTSSIECYKRLAAYEAIGLSPEQVKTLQETLQEERIIRAMEKYKVT